MVNTKLHNKILRNIRTLAAATAQTAVGYHGFLRICEDSGIDANSRGTGNKPRRSS